MTKFFQYISFAIGILTIIASGSGSESNSNTQLPPDTSTTPSVPAITLQGTSKFGQTAELSVYGESSLISSSNIDQQGNYSFRNVVIEDTIIYELGACIDNGFCLKSLMRGSDILSDERVYVSGLTDLVYAMANNQSAAQLTSADFFENQAEALIKIDIDGDGTKNYADILNWTADGGFFDHLIINQNKITSYIANAQNLDRSYSTIYLSLIHISEPTRPY